MPHAHIHELALRHRFCSPTLPQNVQAALWYQRTAAASSPEAAQQAAAERAHAERMIAETRAPPPTIRMLCAGCNQQAVGLRRCARCHSASYCSRECQAAHWQQHKHECQPA